MTTTTSTPRPSHEQQRNTIEAALHPSLLIPAARLGDPTALVTILKHFMLQRWRPITLKYMRSGKGYVLFACSDHRFMETTFRLARNEFQYSPCISIELFWAPGNIEAKFAFLYDIFCLFESEQRRVMMMTPSSPASSPLPSSSSCRGNYFTEQWVSRPPQPPMTFPSTSQYTSRDWLPGTSSPHHIIKYRGESDDLQSEGSSTISSSDVGDIAITGYAMRQRQAGIHNSPPTTTKNSALTFTQRIDSLEARMSAEMARIESQLKAVTCTLERVSVNNNSSSRNSAQR